MVKQSKLCASKRDNNKHIVTTDDFLYRFIYEYVS